MHIQIRSEEDKKINLRLPNSLLTSKLLLRLASGRISRSEDPETQKTRTMMMEIMPDLKQSIRKTKKKYGKFTLVEVESQDGEHVKITL
ncbi:MAG: hypothetical protein GX034_05970 [Clostridiaceae bacterium]|jgi:tRNA A37 threonylcarbamoyladenosine synthetase subunit TsaC/SUA5/YrdC|nr:hypothetical protein [Clostridiaceae bacterium]